MANPHAGEVAVTLDGERHACRLTLGALAELEEATGEGIDALLARFEAGGATGRDVLAVIVAGLRGGGWQGAAGDLVSAEIAGGPAGAARAAAELLARAFAAP
ncbi:gene transfer agent family protein [Limimaricola pyoseonensis]|uniref:Phage tail tube protein, GTA-gp10 n=1 Tax=Limimaricola pyoseonensis TaxID=521013 RepID=A0A1G7AWP4_9RHOB|nr:gene transfer agent family protein [Limimaricola pyoseonensis]SDE19249.1 Phage tail tube protein, GTA-gp10 [Limimaricola pyoseonensis]